MDTSILNSTKKILGIDFDDPSFDLDILTHINAAFSILYQAGIGPAIGFAIVDEDSDWSDFLAPDDPALSLVKTFIYLQVRLLFDPPTTSYLQTAMKEQLEQYLWRLNVMREEIYWVDPTPSVGFDSGGFGL